MMTDEREDDKIVSDLRDKYGAHPLPPEFYQRLDERERRIVERLRQHGVPVEPLMAGARVAREDWHHD